MPTRKWFAATLTGAGALAVMLLTGDSEVTDAETIAIIGYVVERSVAYITPNEKEQRRG
jgi:hypothetical protein